MPSISAEIYPAGPTLLPGTHACAALGVRRTIVLRDRSSPVQEPCMIPARETAAIRKTGLDSSGHECLRDMLAQLETPADPEIGLLLQQAASFASDGVIARQRGEESAAENYFRQALSLATDAAGRIHGSDALGVRDRVLHAATCLALNCGDVAEARRLLAEPGGCGSLPAESEARAQLRDITTWPDVWLVAAVRRDPPDAEALDTLAHRYWKPLFGRCELLTLHRQKASDLAQEAWRKVLRSRTALKPGGNFPAYLNTVATNIWRDWHRAARRAGTMGEDQLASLDAAVSTDDGSTIVLGDVIPDLKSLGAEERRSLMVDIDHALGCLEPHLREVLVARFLNEESCAEIGRRHGRTEQTISAWVREGVRQMKRCLEDSHGGDKSRGSKHES